MRKDSKESKEMNVRLSERKHNMDRKKYAPTVSTVRRTVSVPKDKDSSERAYITIKHSSTVSVSRLRNGSANRLKKHIDFENEEVKMGKVSPNYQVDTIVNKIEPQPEPEAECETEPKLEAASEAEAEAEAEATLDSESGQTSENVNAEDSENANTENDVVVEKIENTVDSESTDIMSFQTDFSPEKQEIELDWSVYRTERDKFSRWLVPWEDNPVPGRYTLTIQSPYSVTKIIRDTKPLQRYYSNEFNESTFSMYNKEEYMEELERLLMFMTPYDRHMTVDRYRAMLLVTENEYEMMEALGTPQRLAAMLAKDYVPTSINPMPQLSEEPSASDKKSAEAEKTEKTFRSVAATLHPDTGEEKTDTHLTTVVDMRQQDSEEDALREGSVENQGETMGTKEASQTILLKSVPCFVTTATLFSAVILAACIAAVVILPATGLIVSFFLLNTLIDTYLTMGFADRMFMTGLFMTAFAVALLLIFIVIDITVKTAKKLFRWIRKGVIIRKNARKGDTSSSSISEPAFSLGKPGGMMRKKVCVAIILAGIVFMFIGYRMGADIEAIAEKLENSISVIISV